MLGTALSHLFAATESRILVKSHERTRLVGVQRHLLNIAACAFDKDHLVADDTFAFVNLVRERDLAAEIIGNLA